MGLPTLYTHSAGRRRSRPGESPFISALTGAVHSAIFTECLYTTSGQAGPKSRRRTRDGGFIYALSADENSLALAAFALQAQSVFLQFQMPLPSPGGNGIFTATPTVRITHYTLLRKVVCQKGLCPLWIPPQQNGAMPLGEA